MSTAIAHRQDTPAAVIQPAGESATILQVIQRAAADPQCDIEKMERLMSMHERFLAKQAEQQYAEALAMMQQELPVITERGGIKDKGGRIQSTYALWEDINEAIKPILAKHGFALTFRIPRNERGIEVEGVLSHRAGHRETTSILLPADTSGNKNAVQAVASSVSYGKRYTAGALLNFTSCGEDDDGQSAGAKPEKLITGIQVKRIEVVVASCSPGVQRKFSEDWPDPSQIPAGQFDAILQSLEGAALKYQKSLKEQQP